LDYRYENLTPDRFQEFAQALLLTDDPDIVCFPVGHADGGRDAIRYSRRSAAPPFTVYQVKFSREPAKVRDPAKWVKDAVTEELPKIERLASEGADSYVLMTNVKGTATPKTGSMDKVADFLETNVPIDARCMWRDDISRRLDSAYDLKWAYPELLSSIDAFRALIEDGLGEHRTRRTNAIRAFLRAQYDADSEVKFRQIELQSGLLDLFIDVPAVLVADRSSRRRMPMAGGAYYLAHRLATPPVGERFVVDPGYSWAEATEDIVGAAKLLLDPRAPEVLPRVVLEGAPGQGKSTIAQYIAQVNRIRLLGETEELERLPAEHRPQSVRLPFKTDLRDLATWFDRRNPFDPDDESVPDDWKRSLEAFLAAQVRFLSGGASFSVADLQEVVRVSATLLIFDGLDEVADIAGRTELVKEVERGVRRLAEVAASLQVIVTTRPTAFSNSPGFSSRDFTYCELVALPRR
jgi:hypothetical protein